MGVTAVTDAIQLSGEAFQADKWAGGKQILEVAAIGQLQVFRGQLRQGIEDEGARLHMVVGDLEAGFVDQAIAKQQDVQVEGSRSPAFKALAALIVFDGLQRIEQCQGRERNERWGPRTLDLDILLFGDRLLDEPRLKVPHYHMHARPFVLYPLAELAPAELRLADGRSLKALLDACPFVGLERLA